jgi:hypothetical protein
VPASLRAGVPEILAEASQISPGQPLAENHHHWWNLATETPVDRALQRSYSSL